MPYPKFKLNKKLNTIQSKDCKIEYNKMKTQVEFYNQVIDYYRMKMEIYRQVPKRNKRIKKETAILLFSNKKEL